MNIGSIYRRAWAAVKNNKVLWVIGLLVMALSSGMSFSGTNNFNSFQKSLNNSASGSASLKSAQDTIKAFDSLVLNLFRQVPLTTWIIVGVSLFFIILAVFAIVLLIRSFAVGALIGGTYEANSGVRITFADIYRFGKQSWVHLAALSLLPTLAVTFLLVAGAGGGAYLIITKQSIFAGILLVILGVTSAALIGLVSAVGRLWGERLVVINNLGWWLAFKEGFKMFWQNAGTSLGLGLMNTLLGCGLSCVIVPVAAIVVLILVIFSLIPFIGLFILPVAIIFVLIGIAGLSLVLGIFTAFKYATWGILFNDLGGSK